MTPLDLLYIPLAAATAPWWARKTRSGWGERFGKIAPLPAKAAGAWRVLLHAVSVGEVATLRGLVPMLREAGVEVVVSASTDTGLARAKALFGGLAGVFVVRFALDFSPAVARFLEAVKPDVVAMVELEVWPNFVRSCRARGVPVLVINGRLSARSFRGYSRLRPFFRRTFGRLSLACVQDAEYAERFRAMGVDAARVRITGSMKWDAAAVARPGETVTGAAELAAALGIDRGRPLVVGGSTAPMSGASGEGSCEEALLHASVPAGVQLLCAPRKPEHVAAAYAALGGAGRCVRRSTGELIAGADRFLLDTIGELRLAYALADVVVVGRTFGELGGSDVIEPVSLSRPTIVGPAVSNFASVVATFDAAGAIERCTASELPGAIRGLLADHERARAMVERGLSCIQGQQGATARHAAAILESLASGGAAR